MKTIVLGPPGTGKTTTLLNNVDDQLKEKCNCENKRVGKEKLSVFAVKEFDKKQEEYKQKVLKEESPY